MPPLFHRYDSPDLPSHLSGGRKEFIKKHNLVGAHWQHKNGGQGITGYADKTAVKMGVDDMGNKLLAHHKENEDHISKAEFDKRYAEKHSQHTEEVLNVRVNPTQFSEDQAEEIVSRGPAGVVAQFGEEEFRKELTSRGYKYRGKKGMYGDQQHYQNDAHDVHFHTQTGNWSHVEDGKRKQGVGIDSLKKHFLKVHG